MTSDFMGRFAFDEQEAADALEQTIAASNERDGRICSCGHPVSKHHIIKASAEVSCRPGLLRCKCEKLNPVIDVPNTRFFMRKSLGNGPLHALSLGIAAIVKSNPDYLERMKWLVDSICDKCKRTDALLMPTNITQSGIILNESSTHNAMLCEQCGKD